MLNKLLKRCMPWMDKGRWYRIDFIPAPDSITIKHDPIFSNVTFNSGAAVAIFANPKTFQIIDSKFVGLKGFTCLGPRINLIGINEDGDIENGFEFNIPSYGTAWFFINLG